MNYEQALEYIHSMPRFTRGTANETLKNLLSHLGNPEKKLKFIHIAGTNGKGSTAFMIAEILKNSEYKTGLFISPYIERFNERIQINNETIPDDSLAEIVSQIKKVIDASGISIPEFALNTCIALCWFYQNNCDIVVLETGLGGRLDSTNIIENPLVSVITAIGLDHTMYLGNTIEEITLEKCGIIKENSPVVVYPIQKESVFDIIRQDAKLKNSELYIADVPKITDNGTVIISDKSYTLGLKGDFQAYNAATVIKTIEIIRKYGYSISDYDIYSGLKKASNPARFESFGTRIILDGAHNPQAIIALCDALKKLNKPVYFCIAMMEDKDCAESAEIISANSDGIIITQLDMPRCCNADKLAGYFKKYTDKVHINVNPAEAIEDALKIAPPDSIICICGSMYLAGKIRSYLHKFT